MNKKHVTQEYYQFWLPEYSGWEKQIYCKKSHHVMARISSDGHLEVFKGCYYKYLCGNKEAAIVRSVLLEIYNTRKGRNFYSRRDIDIIYCNIMKQFKISFIERKACYFLSVCYSVWEKFNRKY